MYYLGHQVSYLYFFKKLTVKTKNDMGKATSMAHRERVVSLKKEEYSFGAISEQLSLSRLNVRDIWTRYRQQGEAGLATSYANSGGRAPKPCRCCGVRLCGSRGITLAGAHPASTAGFAAATARPHPASAHSTAGTPPRAWSSRAARTRVNESGRPRPCTTFGRSTPKRTWYWPTGSPPAT